MENILFYSDNVQLSQEISSILMSQNQHIKILHIISSETDLIKLLQNAHFDFLVIISDNINTLGLFQYLNQYNIENHLNSIFLITNNTNLKNLVKKDRFISKVLTTKYSPQSLAKQISAEIEKKFQFTANLRAKIANELYYLGFKSYHKGTGFMIESILIVYQHDAHLCDNFEKNIYPLVAEKFNTNTANVKSDIIKSINCMYAECEQKKLQKYFHFSTDFRPTTKMIIYTIVSNIAQQAEKNA